MYNFGQQFKTKANGTVVWYHPWMLNNGIRTGKNKISIYDNLLYACIKERSVRVNIKFGIPMTPMTFLNVENSLNNFKMPEIKQQDFENCNNGWISDYENGWQAILDSKNDITWIKHLKGQILYKQYVEPSTVMQKTCTQGWSNHNFDSTDGLT